MKQAVGKKVLYLNFDANDSKKYHMEAIQDSAVYASEMDNYLSEFYYLIV